MKIFVRINLAVNQLKLSAGCHDDPSLNDVSLIVSFSWIFPSLYVVSHGRCVRDRWAPDRWVPTTSIDHSEAVTSKKKQKELIGERQIAMSSRTNIKNLLSHS